MTILTYVKSEIESDKRHPYIRSRLCSKCAAIDSCMSFANVPLELGFISTWETRACDLCYFLSFCIKLPGAPKYDMNEPISLWKTDIASVELQATVVVDEAMFPEVLSNSYSDLIMTQRNQERWLSFVRTPTHVLHPTRITPPSIDWNLVKSWLQTDLDTQWDWLKDGSKLRLASAGSTLSLNDTCGLTVIDCESRNLVQIGNGADYVTLSYVWGSTAVTGTETGGDSSLSQLPPTIEDSARVCLELGYRYLWVDRYCIPQSDCLERHRQIQRMDTIYAMSALTIIACAGRDPQYGLPGVTKLRQCPSLTIHKWGYLQVMPGLTDIHQSVWAGRAWTYQETLLSRRRLYFTDRQLYFESSSSIKCEWASMSEYQMVLGPSHIFSQHTWLGEWPYIWDCIHNFTKRKITFASDTLNAMLGILKMYEQRFQMRHLWGMPFLYFQEYGSNTGSTRKSPLCLFFYNMRSSVRRKGFPSRSWAGWTGHVFWCSPENFGFSPARAFCMSPELASGRVIRWDEFEDNYEAYQQGAHRMSQFIHIEANVSPIASVMSENWHDDRIRTVIQLQGNESLVFEEDPKDAVLEDKIRHDLDRINLMWFPPDGFRELNGYLFICNVGTHWERVTYRTGKFVCPGGLRCTPTSELQTIRLG